MAGVETERPILVKVANEKNAIYVEENIRQIHPDSYVNIWVGRVEIPPNGDRLCHMVVFIEDDLILLLSHLISKIQGVEWALVVGTQEKYTGIGDGI